jgi:hypothetical protein
LHFLLKLHVLEGCNETLTLTNATVFKDLNETCSWTVKSPDKTTILLQVTGLQLTDPRDSVFVMDKKTLIATYTQMDKKGKKIKHAK